MASAAMPQFIGPWDTQIVATAIHAGHDLRPDVAAAMLLSEQDRLREEDPFTDLIAAAVPDRVVTTRSRFEVDLNRPRREAVYRRPEDAWGWTSGARACSPSRSFAPAWPARRASGKNCRSLERHLADVQKPAIEEHIALDEFDVLMLRNDPAQDAESAPWANNAGVAFGQLVAGRGVLVVETLAGLRRQRGLPRQSPEAPNLNQIIEAIGRDGYVVAQEYLPEAKEGNVRFFVMNGRPLREKGAYAAFRRKNPDGDMRSNMSAGGSAAKVVVTDEMLEVIDIVRPKLVADGMFLVGLDIVGDKLMEVNVFSPGGRQRPRDDRCRLRARCHRRSRAQGPDPASLSRDRQPQAGLRLRSSAGPSGGTRVAHYGDGAHGDPGRCDRGAGRTR